MKIEGGNHCDESIRLSEMKRPLSGDFLSPLGVVIVKDQSGYLMPSNGRVGVGFPFSGVPPFDHIRCASIPTGVEI